MIALLAAAAAAEDAPLQADLHGDLKSFAVATFPYDWVFLPPDPYGQGTVDARLKLHAAWRDRVSFELHHAATVVSAPDLAAIVAERLGLPDASLLEGAGAPAGFTTGVGRQAPEVVDLSWRVEGTGPLLQVFGRVDRAVLSVSGRGYAVAVGRQPVTLGAGQVFTPMDLVNPFTPSTIDQEYKPGVDAVRFDGFAGVGGQVTAVAAWAGDWSLDGTVLAGFGRATVGVTDLLGLLAVSHGEPVGGFGLITSAGPVGLHGETTVTVPEGDDPFVRAVVGADGRPTATTSLTGELYLQTLGAADPSGYLELAASERFARGELWQMGRFYAAVAASQEITPLVVASLAVVGNLEDPSALLAPGLSWSVASDAVVAAGAYAGLGARPEDIDLLALAAGEPIVVGSEFGLYPAVAFVQMKAYF